MSCSASQQYRCITYVILPSLLQAYAELIALREADKRRPVMGWSDVVGVSYHALHVSLPATHAVLHLQVRRFWGLDDDGRFWGWDRSTLIEWVLFYAMCTVAFFILRLLLIFML